MLALLAVLVLHRQPERVLSSNLQPTLRVPSFKEAPKQHDITQPELGKSGRKAMRRQKAIASLLGKLSSPGPIASSLREAHVLAPVLKISWGSLPAGIDPQAAALASRRNRPRDAARFERKRRQVEAFAAAVQSLLEVRSDDVQALTVVDFGCSSGNLLLPLAAVFPNLTFVGVDMKRHAVRLLERRAGAAGLSNVRGWHGPIEDYSASGLGMDLALGLHVCGEATDRVLMAATACGAPFAVSPCCIGNVNRRADEIGFIAEIPMSEGEAYTIEKNGDGPASVLLRGERVPLHAAHRTCGDGLMMPVLCFNERTEGLGNEIRRGYFAKRNKHCEGVPVLEFLLSEHDNVAEVGHGSSASFVARRDVILTRRSAPQLCYPRSLWLAQQISAASFVTLASLADTGHREPTQTTATGESDLDDLFYRAKTVVTLDRGMWAQECGYKVALRRIGGMEEYVKDDLLLGWPARVDS